MDNQKNRHMHISQFLKFMVFLFLTNTVFAQNTVKITGTIKGAQSDSLHIAVDPLFLGVQDDKNTLKVPTSGSFSHNFTIERPQVVHLNYRNQSLPLYVEGGDDLSLTFFADGLLKTVEFSGKAAVHNQFLKDFNSKFEEVLNKESMKKKVLSQTVDKLEMDLFKTVQAQKKFLNDHAKKEEFSEGFHRYIKNKIKYLYWNYIAGYPIIEANNIKTLRVKRLRDEVMFDGLEDTSINNKEAIINEYYRSFLVYYTTYFTSKANGFNKFTDYSVSLEEKHKYARENLKGEAFSYVMAHFLSKFAGNLADETATTLRNSLKSRGIAAYTTLVDKQWETWKKATKNPNIAANVPDTPYLMQDLDGNELDLTSFKGKIVYIDFWASWCGPCRKQFPFTKELKKELSKSEKENIVFLYISIDNNEEVWRKSIEKFNIEGKHAISPGGWNSKIARKFRISSIPRYMLMDRDGRIVDENAKRPQKKDELLEDLQRLLDK